MKQRYDLWKKEEYTYSAAFGFQPNLREYLHEEARGKRPCILVVPGGAYRVVSPTEGEIVAEKFYERGYQAFVLTYTTNFLGAEALMDQPVRDLSRAIRFIRRHAEEFHIDPQKVILCGFSAGAHLCGSVAEHFQDFPDLRGEYRDISNRPDAVILSYPVISSGEKGHRDSFAALLGNRPGRAQLEYFSLEKHVTGSMPPCFLWQTVTDECVPVENSLMMAESLKKAGIPFELHLFPRGRHGLSVSDQAWEKGLYQDPYTLEQTHRMIRAIMDGSYTVPPAQKEEIRNLSIQEDTGDTSSAEGRKAEPEAAAWPSLADQWLRHLL